MKGSCMLQYSRGYCYLLSYLFWLATLFLASPASSRESLPVDKISHMLTFFESSPASSCESLSAGELSDVLTSPGAFPAFSRESLSADELSPLLEPLLPLLRSLCLQASCLTC